MLDETETWIDVSYFDHNNIDLTVRTVRAAEWQIDPKRIGILGFSAGGHGASTIGTHFGAGQPKSADVIERGSSPAGRVDLDLSCHHDGRIYSVVRRNNFWVTILRATWFHSCPTRNR
jgi:hypothetical protein